MAQSLTIIIPAFNEENRIEAVIETAATLAREELETFEIVVVNDGSTDATAAAIERAKRSFPEIRVITQPTNKGVGAAYTIALDAATMQDICLIPGDNAFGPDGIRRLFQAAGQADMVISFRANPGVRSPIRRLLSVFCNRLLRLASRCPLRDGHSLYVWPTAWAREISVPEDYRYHLVSLLSLLRRAETYCEVPVDLTERPDKSSGVMRFNIVWGLGMAVLQQILRSYLQPPKRLPRRITSQAAETDSRQPPRHTVSTS